MFEVFTQEHEDAIARLTQGVASDDATGLAAAISALHACRRDVVRALEQQRGSAARLEWQTLYDGLSQLSDFLTTDCEKSIE
ncbi:hypothetical protein [Xylophilus sp. GOD-11R]|uniref:hypothetical protein n=1 Tax=Xylophilus sp. GOD-11R TaxID=3089814 RepID=UPI00298BFA93|nr:hypothetical protein [Xylophilus sp. GOD-11R]WPB57935.1 hypothetical protein R9X41_04625 [Xylophilus sp. GOD-11R]